jgi:hypothetical protein
MSKTHSMRPSSRRDAAHMVGVAMTMAALVASLAGCATSTSTAQARATGSGTPAVDSSTAGPTAETKYGIHVEGLRLTAAGAMLDFRYRVVDPQKAAPILDGRMKPYLLDEAHAAKLGVPDTPVLGRIRQTSRNHKILTNRTYFIMFGNPGKAVQSGDKVTLLLGELKITDLTVQ